MKKIISHKISTILLLLFLTQSCDYATWQSIADSLNESSAIQSGNKLKIEVIKILDFSLIEGKWDWIQNSKSSLLNATIHFDSAYGCTMYIGGRTLKGKYWIESDMIKAFSKYSFHSGGQGTSIKVNGMFRGQTDKSLPGIGVIHFLSSANYYSKVNGTEFRNTVSKEYTCSFEYKTTMY